MLDLQNRRSIEAPSTDLISIELPGAASPLSSQPKDSYLLFGETVQEDNEGSNNTSGPHQTNAGAKNQRESMPQYKMEFFDSNAPDSK